MTLTELDALSNDDLNSCVGAFVMGWTADKINANFSLFHPATDYNSTALMRAEVVRRGDDAALKFLRHLSVAANVIETDWHCSWKLINATPRQQCIAALLAVGGG